MGSHQAVTSGAARNGFHSRLAFERRKVEIRQRDRLGRGGSASWIRATGPIRRPMHFYEFDGACLFMQRVDVLGHEEKLSTAIAVPALDSRQCEMGSVGL